MKKLIIIFLLGIIFTSCSSKQHYGVNYTVLTNDSITVKKTAIVLANSPLKAGEIILYMNFASYKSVTINKVIEIER